MMDVGFAERRESAVNTRLELFKKMRERLSSPETETKLAERRVLVEARNRRNAEKEEIRRKEQARVAAIRAAEEAQREAERRAKEEEERRRIEAAQAKEAARLAAEKERLANSSNARAARALADLMSGRGGREQVRRQA